MIIDLLTQKTTLFNITYYDAINSDMLHNGFSIKEERDILSWRLTNEDIDSVEFIFTSNDTTNLSEIDMYLAGGENNAEHIIKIYTSFDYINWYELPYKKDDNYVYKIIGDNFYNMTTYELTPKDDLLDYAYKQINPFSGEYEFLDKNHEFKYIKIVVTGLTATVANPVYFDRLKIYIDEYIIEDFKRVDILEIKSDMLYQPKLFEELNLIPDLLKNYMKMLEFNGTFSGQINQLTNHHYIKTYDERQYIGYDDAGIGFDYIDFDLIVYPE